MEVLDCGSGSSSQPPDKADGAVAASGRKDRSDPDGSSKTRRRRPVGGGEGEEDGADGEGDGGSGRSDEAAAWAAELAGGPRRVSTINGRAVVNLAQLARVRPPDCLVHVQAGREGGCGAACRCNARP